METFKINGLLPSIRECRMPSRKRWLGSKRRLALLSGFVESPKTSQHKCRPGEKHKIISIFYTSHAF